MQGITVDIAARSPTTRSKVTNGSRLLRGIDGRSADARRYRDLIVELVREHGGESALSISGLAMVRQAASLMLRCEQEQARVVRGEPVNEDALVRLSSEARRILSALRRRTAKRERNVDLAAYLAASTPRSPDDEGSSP
jgi:hypothetical protein